MKLIFLTSVTVLCAPQTRSQLLSSPINTIANPGQKIEFGCSTNATTSLIWDFARVNSTRFDHVYKVETIISNFSSRYRVNKVNTTINVSWALAIDSVDMDHAGTYRCQNTPTYNPQDRNASAQLFVIDSDPVCGTNASNGSVVAGDYIQMWCTVNYSGNWIFVMECSINGQISDRPTHNTYQPRRVTSSLTKQLFSSDNGVTLALTCKMSLNPNSKNNVHVPAQVDKTMATNIPHYQYSWNYTANVLYGPRNQSIFLVNESRLQCFAEGSPAPDYEWKIIGKNVSLYNGSILVIHESMLSGEGQTLRCTARNSVAGQIRSNEATYTFSLTPTIASPLNVPSVLPPETILIIGISIGALVICLAIAVITCIYKIRRIGSKDADEKVSGEPDQQPTYGIVNKVRKGNLVKCERCKELSLHPQDYEMVDECNQKSGVFGKPSTSPAIAKKEGTEHHSLDTTDCENYSALQRRSSATFPQPAIYAELQQYANTSI